jgi:hypothetical protein
LHNVSKMRQKPKYIWNIRITEKCHLLFAVHFFYSVQYEATFSTVTERTEADILCAVKCWMLNVTHNKHIPLHICFVAPYGTTVLCKGLLHLHFIPSKFSVSADPNHHQFKINLFSPMWTCSSVDAYNHTSHYTDGMWKDVLLNFLF